MSPRNVTTGGESKSNNGSARRSILAIDGNSLLYRAYFALPNTIRDPSGRPVNAIHGFISMLARLLRDHQPSGVLIAYDSPWPTIRHSTFPAYKGNRDALPEELLAQVPLLQTLLQQTGISGLAVAGYEGDDILASLAEHCIDRRISLLLVTGDRDLFQLVTDPWVRILYTKRGVNADQILDEAGVRQLVGVSPSRHADFSALRGDVADNIAGIAGIGTKGAIRIIDYAPSFEQLYEHPEGLPSALARKLFASRELLLRNRDLMRPLAGVPVNWDTRSLSWAIDHSAAKEAFGELGLAKTGDMLLAVLRSPKVTQSSGALAEDVAPRDGHRSRGKRVCLVACCAEKTAAETKAEDLYVSALFKKSRAWAEMAGGPWYILSAKHGLVSPDQVLRPYDTSLKDARQDEREQWGKKVVAQLAKVTSPPDLLFMLAGSLYTGSILKDVTDAGYRVAQPMEGMSIGRRLQWLNSELELGRAAADLEDFYEILTWLASHTDGHRLVADADQGAWPERGVYFFFEPGEDRLCSARPRVVRVGTHAVSAYSKATLWNRLRTHRGVAEGGGNHRSSIFRSHVGAAILRRDSRANEFPHWGDQSAGTNSNKASESELERLVSAAISQMRIVSVEIQDSPGPRSDRAYIERNAIALLSRVGSQIDCASQEWLGRWSAHPAIRKSGLWNVNYVNEHFWDAHFLEVFDYYARATVGKVPFVSGSIAPAGWWDRTRSRDQLSFRWSHDGSGTD